MQVNYLGHSCFRLRSNQSSVLMDPFSPKFVGLPMQKTTADIVTISHHHLDHDDLQRVKNEAFVIDGPGEYEISGISILGLPTFENKEDKLRNICFLVEIDGIRVVHLGDLGYLLTEQQLDILDGVDVLLVKAGGKGTGNLSIADTIKLINQIEPSIVVPMHYRARGMDEKKWSFLPTLTEFVKEFGAEGERLDKLVVSKASLPEETKLIILER